MTVTLLLGSGVLVQLRTPGLWPVGPFFFLVGLSHALAVTFLLTLPLVERRRWLIDVQLATDTVVISAVVLLTGGVSSYFSILYALPIIGASILQFHRSESGSALSQGRGSRREGSGARTCAPRGRGVGRWGPTSGRGGSGRSPV